MADRTFTLPSNDRRRTRELTKADLIAATKRLLRQGTSVANLSVDRIVAEAGMARATYYLHFRDKFELVAGLMDDVIAWRGQIGAEVLEDPGMTRESLDAILATIVGQWADEHAVLSAIIELSEYDARMAELWRAAIGEVAREAARHFRIRWEHQPDAPPDIDTIAELLSWMFERACHQMLVDPSRHDVVAAGMSEIIWRVLTYSPAGGGRKPAARRGRRAAAP
jgi:AcrR family transcriptional regulator